LNIALTAHDSKKELLVQFCIAYSGILAKHSISATDTTRSQVVQATGLNIQKYLSGPLGGNQQIASRISCNEIDLLIFFRDPLLQSSAEHDDMSLLRLCDIHNVPVATNIATAEALIHALERGDLDWRILVNPTYN
jgi:methylglyoxal synthase